MLIVMLIVVVIVIVLVIVTRSGSKGQSMRGGLDSSLMWTSRGGILVSIGNFPEMLSQRILVGTIFSAPSTGALDLLGEGLRGCRIRVAKPFMRGESYPDSQ